jgi:hypothetical protein
VGSQVYPPDPLSPILLGGTINLLAAAPGTGKSTLLAWLSRKVRDREPLWGRKWGEIPWQGIICADRSWDRSTRRWFALEGMQDLPAYSLQDDRDFKKAKLRHRHQRIAVFEHCLQQLSPSGDGQFPLGSLLYVDPLALFLGGNLLDYDTCLVACSEIRELCADRGLTVIGTAHSAKQKANKDSRYLRLQDRILGSTALFGYTDTQMYIAAPGEIDDRTDYYVFLWHPHHAPAATFRFDRDPQGRFQDGGPLDRPPHEDDPPWLLEALGQRAWKFLELVELAEAQEPPCISRATLNRRLTSMLAQGRVKKPKTGWWELVKPS